MGRFNLQFTLTGRGFTATPLSAQTAERCTRSPRCQNLASHRLLIRRGSAAADVELLCDAHMVEWADEQGTRITTAKLPRSA